MPTRAIALTVLLGALTIAGSQRAVARDQAPAVAPNPDAVVLESLRASSMLDWKGEQQRVGYANMDKLAPGNVIRRAAQPGQLPESPRDFSTFTY